ncbi:MAG: hypothetical protein FJ109_03120 [Deltaproteobacteria bacterium]|nr:hypothetical protein [Deltaproteobacteria bacterium]
MNTKRGAVLVVGLMVIGGCGGAAGDRTGDVAEVEAEIAPDDVRFLPADIDASSPDGQVVADEIGPPEVVGPCDGELLCPCVTNEDCVSAWCVEHLGSKVCTQTCETECPPGMTCQQVGGTFPDIVWLCVSDHPRLCRPCLTHEDCRSSPNATNDWCVDYGMAGWFCGTLCVVDGDCPDGYGCMLSPLSDGGQVKQCVNKKGVCPCSDYSVAEGFATACFQANEFGTCPGEKVCESDGMGPCDAPEPLAEECNGLDEDCDGTADDDLDPQPCQVDNELGSCPGVSVCKDGIWQSCDAQPAQEESCNGIDDDCNGATDEGFPDFDKDLEADCVDLDDDGDGVPDALDNCPMVPNKDQANKDGDGAGDACDEDADGDGTPDTGDCAPLDPLISPDAQEDCSTPYDDNCDGSTNDLDALGCIPWYFDGDADGFGISQTQCACEPQGDWAATVPGDCDDAASEVNPGAAELCGNLLDEDCDGNLDNGFEQLGQSCDGDDSDSCETGQWTCAVDGKSAACENEVGPAFAELCDGQDNDCDGAVDEEEDLGTTTCGLGPCLHTVPKCIDGQKITCYANEGAKPEMPDLIDNDCDGLADEDFLAPGSILITEIMQNPGCVSDATGEWFEIYNPTPLAWDLSGWILADDEEDFHVISKGKPFVIGPGEYRVLARSADPALNGGIEADYGYDSFQMENSADQINLKAGQLLVDRVAYDGGPGFPDPEDASMNLSADAHDSAMNDDGKNWCASEQSTPGTCGLLGTPGFPNPMCDADGDGFSPPGGDCDDSNALVFPGAAEKCNGIDDDCSGVADDPFPALGMPCDGPDPDSCEGGTYTCAPDGMDVECVNEDPAGIKELCDGKDNNCDGSIDEGFPSLGQPCDGGDADLCPNGKYTCKADGSGTECVNENPSGVIELCDGKDNDCDGDIDEDFPLLGQVCDGPDSDQCKNGKYACGSGGLLVECANENPANIPELCDGKDNDCDGGIDEDFSMLGQACDGPDGDVCKNGTWTCASGGTAECANENPADIKELCDGQDNDCDGAVDEGDVCCKQLGAQCNADGGCCSGICNVGCCAAPCQPDGWACNGSILEMRDFYCGEGGVCKYSVTGSSDCGGPGFADSWQCAGQVLQRQYVDKGCSGTACFSNPTWSTVSSCAGTCASWCNNGKSACGAAPQGTQNAADCMSDGWVCNGINREFRDYSCNGSGSCAYSVTQTEKGGGSCTVAGLKGVCQTGQLQCQNGSLVCVQTVFPSGETCDGLDNNCDGQVDEGSVCGPGYIYNAQMNWNDSGVCSGLGGKWGSSDRCWTKTNKLSYTQMNWNDSGVCSGLGGKWGSSDRCWFKGDTGAVKASVMASVLVSVYLASPAQMNWNDSGVCSGLGGQWGSGDKCYYTSGKMYRAQMNWNDSGVCSGLGGKWGSSDRCWSKDKQLYYAQMNWNDSGVCSGLGGSWGSSDRCWHGI